MSPAELLYKDTTVVLTKDMGGCRKTQEDGTAAYGSEVLRQAAWIGGSTRERCTASNGRHCTTATAAAAKREGERDVRHSVPVVTKT